MLVLAQPGIESVVARNGELRFDAEERAAGALSIALGQARIPVTALIPEMASLEELFLEMTSAEPSDEAVA